MFRKFRASARNELAQRSRRYTAQSLLQGYRKTRKDQDNSRRAEPQNGLQLFEDRSKVRHWQTRMGCRKTRLTVGKHSLNRSLARKLLTKSVKSNPNLLFIIKIKRNGPADCYQQTTDPDHRWRLRLQWQLRRPYLNI
jgi:hypothetical protein